MTSEVYSIINLQVLGNDVIRLPTEFLSAVAITLFPGVVGVVEFGGRIADLISKNIAETTIFTFGELFIWGIIELSHNNYFLLVHSC